MVIFNLPTDKKTDGRLSPDKKVGGDRSRGSGSIFTELPAPSINNSSINRIHIFFLFAGFKIRLVAIHSKARSSALVIFIIL